MSLELRIPNVVWPEQSGIYKVVQFMIEGVPYLEFNRKDEIYHGQIIDRFAKKMSIQMIVRKVKDEPLKFFKDGEKYKIQGMGYCDLNLMQRIAEFYGSSQHYDISIDQRHLELIKPFAPDINIQYNPSRRK